MVEDPKVPVPSIAIEPKVPVPSIAIEPKVPVPSFTKATPRRKMVCPNRLAVFVLLACMAGRVHAPVGQPTGAVLRKMRWPATSAHNGESNSGSQVVALAGAAGALVGALLLGTRASSRSGVEFDEEASLQGETSNAQPPLKAGLPPHSPFMMLAALAIQMLGIGKT